MTPTDLKLHLQRVGVPAQEESHIEERGEQGEELEGEHLDSEAPLCGSIRVYLLCKHTHIYLELSNGCVLIAYL